MKFIRSFAVAIMTYSVIPMPNVKWEPDNTRYAIAFFPCVGIIIGALLYAWHYICGYVGLGNMIFAVGAIAIPVLITGGIHIDGYMDTIDALASHTEKERMLEILKDSRVGAFAVIYEVLYMIIAFAVFAEIGLYTSYNGVIVLCIGYILSRGLSGLLASILPNARQAGMLNSMMGSREKKITVGVCIWLGIVILMCVASMACFGGALATVCMLAGAGVACVYFGGRVVRKLGGITGDTSGYFLQICELYMLIGFYVSILLGR